MRSYEKSRALYERACQSLAGGVASEFRRFSHPHPLFYERGAGSRIWDVDGNEYLDFTLSQGPLILGHSPASVLERVAAASQVGQLFAGQHLLELELAERLQSLIPCAERLRFSLSGSEADQAALRVARAQTGRPKFIRFEGHYHGWLDSVAFGVGGASEAAMGPREAPTAVPWSQGLAAHATEEAITLPWNDLALAERVLETHWEEVAAIITEPVMCNSGCIPPKPGFLEGLRALCDRYEIALIFDEVITGFRLGLGGAQKRFGVTPDLAVFGKALANGYPISALVGRESWMRLIAEGKAIHAGTMNTGQPSVAAALATLDVLERDAVPQALEAKGLQLMEGLRQIAQETNHTDLLVQGMGAMFHLGFTTQASVKDYRDTLRYDKAKYARFLAEMQERGIRLIGRGLWYVSAAHSQDDIDHCLAQAKETLERMQP